MALTPPERGRATTEAGPAPAPDSFVAALVGDGTPLLLCTALALAFAGGFAVFLSLSGTFLPHDLAYLGLDAADLCRLHGCRIVHFMIHDRLSFGGTLLAVATLYAWLALFPLAAGEAWAWWLLVLSGVAGFGSFLAYFGYGYLDSWHGLATLLLLPIFLAGLWLTRSQRSFEGGLRGILAPGWSPTGWRSAAGGGRLLLLLTALGMIAAGGTILAVGMTSVFVPEDLAFMGLREIDLQAINPRLVPLIAHDRAGFGGGLLSTGLLVLGIVWKAAPRPAVWQALLLAGVFGFGAALGVHYPIGYTTFTHVAPAWSGALIFGAGMVLSDATYRAPR